MVYSFMESPCLPYDKPKNPFPEFFCHNPSLEFQPTKTAFLPLALTALFDVLVESPVFPMPTIKWNKPELTSFFGVIPTSYKEPHCSKFDISRDGLRLLVTIFDTEGSAHASLFRDGLPEPVITIRRENCTHAQLDLDSKRRQFLEIGSPKSRVTEKDLTPVLTRGFRIYLEPQIKIELIEGRSA